MTDHPELEAEQAYIDHAYLCLEEMRRVLERVGDAGIGEVEAAVLEAWSARRLVTFEDAERGLCFGRLDLDGVLRPLYVGRRWVHESRRRSSSTGRRPRRGRSTRRPSQSRRA